MKRNTLLTILTIILAIGIIAGSSVYVYSRINHKNMRRDNNTHNQDKMKDDHDKMSMSPQAMAKMVTDEKSFISEMIPHHQEAVDSSKKVLETTQDDDIKNFANNIIETQNKEIERMKSWYQSWYGSEYKATDNQAMMMSDLGKLQGVEKDREYVMGMLMHHRGAVEMSRKVLTFANNRSETTALAQNIITSQSTEITQLESWSQSKYNSTKKGDMMDHGRMGY
jgi:uncharacterized protein (DUF305 family)